VAVGLTFAGITTGAAALPPPPPQPLAKQMATNSGWSKYDLGDDAINC